MVSGADSQCAETTRIASGRFKPWAQALSSADQTGSSINGGAPWLKYRAGRRVRRGPCPTDRRSTYAVLTDEGFAAIEHAAPGHVAGVRRHVFDRLTPAQVQQMREIGQAIAEPLLRGEL